MIKRSGAFLLSVLYAVTVFGFAINLHYCGRLLTSVGINAPAKNCGMYAEAKMKCCHDKNIEVKVKDAHQGQSTSVLAKKFAFEIPQLPFAGHHVLLPQTGSAPFLNKAPPDDPPEIVPAYLKNCSFRI